MAELYGVRTAFQEGGDNDPVNLAAAMHLDAAIVNFGIQEENHFTEQELELSSSAHRAGLPVADLGDRPPASTGIRG